MFSLTTASVVWWPSPFWFQCCVNVCGFHCFLLAALQLTTQECCIVTEMRCIQQCAEGTISVWVRSFKMNLDIGLISLLLSVLVWCSSNAFAHLNGFPVTPLHRVFHLITGIKTWKRGEGVDPGTAWAWECPHEAGDAAQSRGGVWWQRWVCQQLGHQVPGLIDDWEVHAIATHCTLCTRMWQKLGNRAGPQRPTSFLHIISTH